jgi:hypothetical protein
MANSPSVRGEGAGGRVATYRRLDSKDDTTPTRRRPLAGGGNFEVFKRVREMRNYLCRYV